VKLEFNLVTVDFFIQNWCLNDSTVELNEKLSKKNISMLLETFMYKKQKTRSINEGRISQRVIMTRKEKSIKQI
jgi:hypothetical protein